MKRSILAIISLGVALSAAPVLAQQQKIPHSQDSIKATGDGNSVGMRGRAVELAGSSLKVGDKLPSDRKSVV